MRFDFDAAIKEAVRALDTFKEEFDGKESPVQMSPDVLKEARSVIEKSVRGLGMAKDFGVSIPVSSEVKEHVKRNLDYFLNDHQSANKLSEVSEHEGWDYAAHLKKLSILLCD